METYKRNPNIECKICRKPIYRRPKEISINKGNVFCSMDCYGKSIIKEHPCVICKRPIAARLNKKTCSRSCANKNRAGIKYTGRRLKDKIVSTGLLKIRLIEIRGGKCERCGYNKREILNVHHKDRNRKNNELSNLELICPNCHSEEHYLTRSWIGKHYKLMV
jgi:5-methylcytosine-specific restriction endonuclease McrA